MKTKSKVYKEPEFTDVETIDIKAIYKRDKEMNLMIKDAYAYEGKKINLNEADKIRRDNLKKSERVRLDQWKQFREGAEKYRVENYPFQEEETYGFKIEKEYPLEADEEEVIDTTRVYDIEKTPEQKLYEQYKEQNKIIQEQNKLIQELQKQIKKLNKEVKILKKKK